MGSLQESSLPCLSNPIISQQEHEKLEDMQHAIYQEKETKDSSDLQFVDYYCGDHQKLEWNNQETACQPFIVKETEDMGMGWFATRDLEPGCILLEELPAIQAPGWRWSTLADEGRKCLTCGINLSMDSLRTCSTCFWPVCSETCEKNPLHMENECKELASRKFKFPPPPTWPTGMFIMCLRANVMKTRNPEKFAQLMALKDCCNIPSVNQRVQNIDLPAGMFDELKGSNSLNHDEFQKFLRIRTVNCFETDPPDSEPGSKNESYLVYLKTSRINHSCFPNCAFSFSPEPSYKIKVFTSIPVIKGQQLTINYYETWTAQSTVFRQKITSDAGFICKCKKCLDPTELGSFVSGIKCFNCSSHLKADSDLGFDGTKIVGFLVPADPMEKHSPNRVFECHQCHVQHPFWKVIKALPSEVQNAILNSEQLINSKPVNLEALEFLLQRYEESRDFKDHLHQNHWFIQAATRKLIKRQKTPVEKMTNEELKRRMGRLEFLLMIDDQLFAGLHVTRFEDLFMLKHTVLLLKQKFGQQMDSEEVEKLDRTFRKTREELLKFANLGFTF